jgi:hypothetical protein
MSCPPPNTKWQPKWGSSHSCTTVELLLTYRILLWDCMHDYHYDYGIVFVCTIMYMRVVCTIMSLWLWYLYALLFLCFGVVFLHLNVHRSCQKFHFFPTPVS